MLRMAHATCLAMLALLVAAAPAGAAAVFGFDVNYSDPGQKFTYTGGGDNVATLAATATVDFTIRIDGNTPQVYDDAVLSFGGTQVDSFDFGSGNLLYFDGNFTVTDAASGHMVLTGDFTRAHMMLMDMTSAAAISASSDESGLALPGGMDYTAGAAFVDYMVSIGAIEEGELLGLVPTEDMSFTLTNMDYTDEPISGFTANSSFSGNAAYVPEPLTLTVLAGGGLALLGRRRRRRD